MIQELPNPPIRQQGGMLKQARGYDPSGNFPLASAYDPSSHGKLESLVLRYQIFFPQFLDLKGIPQDKPRHPALQWVESLYLSMLDIA